MVLTWNRILESATSGNKPLLPYQEWNIDFSELTVGTRVGIGKNHFYIVHRILHYRYIVGLRSVDQVSKEIKYLFLMWTIRRIS